MPDIIIMTSLPGNFIKYQRGGITLARLNRLQNGNVTVYLGSQRSYDIPAALGEELLVNYMSAIVLRSILS